MRHVLPLLAALLCVVSISMEAEEWKKNYQIAGKPDILVTTGMDIDVDVRAWDEASVEAKVVTEGWPVKKIHIKENQKGDRIELRVGPPHVSNEMRGCGQGRDQCRLDKQNLRSLFVVAKQLLPYHIDIQHHAYRFPTIHQ